MMKQRWSTEETSQLAQMKKKLRNEIGRRRQLPDVVGDRRLLRFLRGHGHNVEKACNMFSKFLKWRDEFDVDSIRDRILYDGMKYPTDFPCGKKILELVPQMMMNSEAQDYLGNPISLEQFNFVPEIVLREITKSEYATFMIYTLEYKILMLEQLAHEREKEFLLQSSTDASNVDSQGHAIRQGNGNGRRKSNGSQRTDNTDNFIYNEYYDDHSKPYGVLVNSRVIRDLDGFGLGHVGTDGQTVMKWILEIAVDNYPELLFKCHMINVPWIFNSIWFFVKGLMDPRTAKKVTITGKDFFKGLSEEIPISAIPCSIGGNFQPSNMLFKFDLTEDGPFFSLAGEPKNSFNVLNPGKVRSMSDIDNDARKMYNHNKNHDQQCKDNSHDDKIKNHDNEKYQDYNNENENSSQVLTQCDNSLIDETHINFNRNSTQRTSVVALKESSSSTETYNSNQSANRFLRRDSFHNKLRNSVHMIRSAYPNGLLNGPRISHILKMESFQHAGERLVEVRKRRVRERITGVGQTRKGFQRCGIANGQLSIDNERTCKSGCQIM